MWFTFFFLGFIYSRANFCKRFSHDVTLGIIDLVVAGSTLMILSPRMHIRPLIAVFCSLRLLLSFRPIFDASNQPHATIELVVPDPITQGIGIMAGIFSSVLFCNLNCLFLLLVTQSFAALNVLKMHGFQRSILLSPRRPPLDCSLHNSGGAGLCSGILEVTPMQPPRSHICYSSTSGLLLQPSSVQNIIALEPGIPQASHMYCGEWANPATIVPVDDVVISFLSVEAVEAAAGSGAQLFGAEMCEAWKKLSESNLWISSWTDFPKVAKDTCYTIMRLCDSPGG